MSFFEKASGDGFITAFWRFAGPGRVFVVGNSSSGLKETPAFHCPTVDIGPRQSGRLRGENVLHVPCETDAIVAAIDTCITDGAFRAHLKDAPNPYGQGNAGPTIATLLKELDLSNPALLAKQTIL